MSTSGGYAESSTIRPRHIHTVRGARLSFYGLTGNRTEKVVPEFKTLATSIVPPSASIMALQIASARPECPSARERALSAR